MLPIGIRFSSSFHMNFDGANVRIPMPFCLLELHVGTPASVTQNLQIEEMDNLKNQFTKTLNELTN